MSTSSHQLYADDVLQLNIFNSAPVLFHNILWKMVVCTKFSRLTPSETKFLIIQLSLIQQLC